MKMKRIHILAFALFAVLASSAMVASSAFAVEPEWGVSGKALTVETATEVTGELILADLKVPLLGKAEVLCAGTFDGTVGPGKADLITKVLVSGVEFGELGSSGGGITCVNLANCPEPLVYPDGLPWDTELMTLIPASGEEPEGVDNLILGAGFSVECMGNGTADLCSVLEGLQILENGTGGVLVAFWKEENAGSCTLGGANSADVLLETGADPIIKLAGGTSGLEILNP